jgi:hypothetical protein
MARGENRSEREGAIKPYLRNTAADGSMERLRA